MTPNTVVNESLEDLMRAAFHQDRWGGAVWDLAEAVTFQPAGVEARTGSYMLLDRTLEDYDKLRGAMQESISAYGSGAHIFRTIRELTYQSMLNELFPSDCRRETTQSDMLLNKSKLAGLVFDVFNRIFDSSEPWRDDTCGHGIESGGLQGTYDGDGVDHHDREKSGVEGMRRRVDSDARTDATTNREDSSEVVADSSKENSSSPGGEAEKSLSLITEERGRKRSAVSADIDEDADALSSKRIKTQGRISRSRSSTDYRSPADISLSNGEAPEANTSTEQTDESPIPVAHQTSENIHFDADATDVESIRTRTNARHLTAYAGSDVEQTADGVGNQGLSMPAEEPKPKEGVASKTAEERKKESSDLGGASDRETRRRKGTRRTHGSSHPIPLPTPDADEGSAQWARQFISKGDDHVAYHRVAVEDIVRQPPRGKKS